MGFRWRYDSADRGEIESWGSGSISDDVRKKNKLALTEPPPTLAAFSGESRYLTPLLVSARNGQPSVSSQTTSDFKLGTDKNDLQAKIKATLTLLTFREQRVIIQFWCPLDFGKHKLLTTTDQPFGVGAIDEGVIDEGLNLYRKHSVANTVLVVKDLEEEDHSPLARVFRHGLPEWTLDLTNYLPKQFQQQECAIRCNFRGYMALPVFDSTTGSCVGVLELLTSSKYISFAFEVQQVHTALKMADLTSPQAFDYPALDVHNEQKHNELEKIFKILKEVCGIHKLPLAQTWAVSPSTSFACHEQILEKTCNSFDTRCLKKVCMSTAALPFHVQDLSMWPFRKACRRRHLDQSRSFVGKVLLSRSSWFCRDVTKLSEDEYPLVYNARMSGLMSCFAIFLHSVEFHNDYVLELFLPLGMEDGKGLPRLVQTLIENIEIASEFELGDTSCMQVVGPPPTNVSCLSLDTDPCTVQISSNATSKSNILETISSDSESMVTNVAKIESAKVPNQRSFKQNGSNKYSDIITPQEKLTVDLFKGDVNVLNARQNEDTTSSPDASMQKKSNMITDAGDKRSHLKQGRKRKIDSLKMEEVQQHLGKPIGEAAKSLNVSRSTLKRFCREHEIPSWPLPKHSKKAANVTTLKRPQKSESEQHLQQPTNVLSSMHVVVFLLIRVKRWSCSGKRHVFSGRWWSCGKHSSLPSKSDYMYQVARLIVQLRRWKNKISIRNALQKRDQTAVSESTSKPKYTTNITHLYSHFDWQLPESILINASPKQNGADYIYRVARLMVQLRRWRNKISIRHALQKRDHPAVSQSKSKPKYTTNITNPYWHFDWQHTGPILVHASPKQNVSDIQMVTVKVTHKDDMIKFQIPTSSGLLELENQVAQRMIELKSRFSLKYMDEDNDLILLACDVDLHNLLRFSASNSTLKLFIKMVSD